MNVYVISPQNLEPIPYRVQFLLVVSWGGVKRSPLGTLAPNWPTVSAPDDRR
jgi:hypothetical protein